jgi:uridine phosphorylase
MIANSYPILEHEYEAEAKIEPGRVIRPRDVPEHCVVTFFGEVIEKVVSEKQAKVVVADRWEDGPHPLYEFEYKGRRLAFFHPGVGGALSAALLEEVIAFGCRKFMVCGGCGVLQQGLAVGKLIVVTAALRDEGSSYHYLPPAREVTANAAAVQALQSVLDENKLPYLAGKTWTTDAPYRETQATIDARRAEGALVVEMEAASLMAVAQFRGVPLGQVLYAGDDLSGDVWDHRGWQSRSEVRESLFWLAAEACFGLGG